MRACSETACLRPVKARGLCNTHYQSARLAGTLPDFWVKASSRKGMLNIGGLPNRILDVLETDGGWLTADGIALWLNANPDTVWRALYRLQKTARVETRAVELAGGQKGTRNEVVIRREWRLT